MVAGVGFEGDERGKILKVHGSTEIVAPPEKVWPFLVEPDKTMSWFTNLKKFEYTGEQQGMGTTFYWEEESGGRTYKLNFVNTEWVENEVFGYKMTSGDFFKSYTERWELEATPSGCRFSFNDQIEFPWWLLGRIIVFFAQRRSAADGQRIMANLKRLAEAQ